MSNSSRTSRLATRYAKPHFAEARTWHQFTRFIRPPDIDPFRFLSEEDGERIRADHAKDSVKAAWYAVFYRQKEEALRWSLGRRTTGFCIPTTLQTCSAHDRGLSALSSRSDSFPELEARRSYDAETETEHVDLLVHASSPDGSVEKLPVGRLPEPQAVWVLPLLKEHLTPRIYVARVDRQPATRRGQFPSNRTVVHVVIADAPACARTWIDLVDERSERQEARRKEANRQTWEGYVRRRGECVQQDDSLPAAYLRDLYADAYTLEQRAERLEKVGRNRTAATVRDELASREAEIHRREARQQVRHTLRRQYERIHIANAEDWLRSEVGSIEESDNVIPFSSIQYGALSNTEKRAVKAFVFDGEGEESDEA